MSVPQCRPKYDVDDLVILANALDHIASVAAEMDHDKVLDVLNDPSIEFRRTTALKLVFSLDRELGVAIDWDVQEGGKDEKKEE